MKQLGITYQHATPQSMGDQWWFWNCENIPEELPEHIEELTSCKDNKPLDPMEQIGWGFSKDRLRLLLPLNPIFQKILDRLDK